MARPRVPGDLTRSFADLAAPFLTKPCPFFSLEVHKHTEYILRRVSAHHHGNRRRIAQLVSFLSVLKPACGSGEENCAQNWWRWDPPVMSCAENCSGHDTSLDKTCSCMGVLTVGRVLQRCVMCFSAGHSSHYSSPFYRHFGTLEGVYARPGPSEHS